MLKQVVSAPRPYLMSACFPNVSAITPEIQGSDSSLQLPTLILTPPSIPASFLNLTLPLPSTILLPLQACQPRSMEELKTACQSWPSGHAALSAVGGVFLAAWLWGKLGGNRRRAESRFWVMVLVATPVVGGWAIAATVWVDYVSFDLCPLTPWVKGSYPSLLSRKFF